MYLICTDRPIEAFNKAESLRNAIQYGYLPEAPAAWTVHATVPNYDLAKKVGQFIANEKSVQVTLRSAYLDTGSHYFALTIDPEPKPEVELLDALDKYDGCPADTGSV